MDIAVIGTGRMGTGLARQMVGAGHSVAVGSRDRGRAEEQARRVGAAAHGTYHEVAPHAEAVVLAIPWEAVDETLAEMFDLLHNRILIDITNPYVGGHLELLGGGSTAEHIQAHVPRARVVKAWNHVFAGTAGSSPDFGGTAETVFVCSDDAAARASVLALAAGMGYDPVDAGPLRSARYLEPLAGLMTTLAFDQGLGTGIALRLLRR